MKSGVFFFFFFFLTDLTERTFCMPQETIQKEKSLGQLFATPWTVDHQAPLPMGFSRPEYYSGLPFPSPGDLPNPGIEPGSPEIRADALPSEPPGNLTGNYIHSLIITYSGKESEKEQHVYALSPLHISRFCSRSASVSPVYSVSPTKLALVPN